MEYLIVDECQKLCERPFENLHKLIRIDLISCDFSQFDFDSLNSITSLEVVKISAKYWTNRNCSVKIDLNKLINLKWLDLKLHQDSSIEIVTNGFNQLTKLYLFEGKLACSNRFSLPALKRLDTLCVDLSTEINVEWFKCSEMLIELSLLSAELETLKEFEMVPDTFEGLECLEYINISLNSFDWRSLDKAAFDGLKSLNSLRIRDYRTSDDEIAHLEREGLTIS